MTAKGALVAASVAGLFASAAPLIASADKTADKVHCDGGNACKGKSECSTANSSCSGSNACKGKGWITTTAENCKKAGGKPATAKK